MLSLDRGGQPSLGFCRFQQCRRFLSGFCGVAVVIHVIGFAIAIVLHIVGLVVIVIRARSVSFGVISSSISLSSESLLELVPSVADDDFKPERLRLNDAAFARSS